MTEIGPVHAVPNAFSENVKVNKTFKIPAIPMTVFSEKLQKDVDVPVPHSHFGTAPVSCRLISAVKFPGMVKQHFLIIIDWFLCCLLKLFRSKVNHQKEQNNPNISSSTRMVAVGQHKRPSLMKSI